MFSSEKQRSGVVNQICPLRSLKGLHLVKFVQHLAEACRCWIDIDAALNKPKLLHEVACTVSFLLETFLGCFGGMGISRTLTQLSQTLFSSHPPMHQGQKYLCLKSPQRLLETHRISLPGLTGKPGFWKVSCPPPGWFTHDEFSAQDRLFYREEWMRRQW